jgi:hypothetical protein
MTNETAEERVDHGTHKVAGAASLSLSLPLTFLFDPPSFHGSESGLLNRFLKANCHSSTLLARETFATLESLRLLAP